MTRDEGFRNFIDLLEKAGVLDANDAINMRGELPSTLAVGMRGLINQNLKQYANDRISIPNYISRNYNPGILGYLPHMAQ